MTRSLLLLVVALAAWAGVCAAQPKAAEAPKAKSEATAKSDSGVGQTMKDSWITSKTKMSLVKNTRVKARQITVETQGGVVALRGKVGSTDERAIAEDVAKGIDGVKRVSNTLEVVPAGQRDVVDTKDAEIRKTVNERLQADGRLKEADIKVRADNGMVTLMGSVADTQSRARAGDVARKVPGVRAVRNELRPKS